MHAFAPATVDAIRTRGAALGNNFRVVLASGTQYFEGPDGLERLLQPHRKFVPADHEDVLRQLGELERQAAQRMPPSEERRAGVVYDEELGRETQAEFRREYERREAQLNSTRYTNELLERVVAALERRQ